MFKYIAATLTFLLFLASLLFAVVFFFLKSYGGVASMLVMAAIVGSIIVRRDIPNTWKPLFTKE